MVLAGATNHESNLKASIDKRNKNQNITFNIIIVTLTLASIRIITITPKQQQNFINKQIKFQKYCPQLARLFEAGQCVQNIRNKD